MKGGGVQIDNPPPHPPPQKKKITLKNPALLVLRSSGVSNQRFEPNSEAVSLR